MKKHGYRIHRERFKLWLQSNGMTYEDFARAGGLSLPHVQHMIAGRRRVGPKVILALLNLGLDREEIELLVVPESDDGEDEDIESTA